MVHGVSLYSKNKGRNYDAEWHSSPSQVGQRVFGLDNCVLPTKHLLQKMSSRLPWHKLAYPTHRSLPNRSIRLQWVCEHGKLQVVKRLPCNLQPPCCWSNAAFFFLTPKVFEDLLQKDPFFQICNNYFILKDGISICETLTHWSATILPAPGFVSRTQMRYCRIK